ncbi:hypothetical protein DFJ77DRAFT_172081 [Powellomyces hirtus]|nr:hypothetical protein DFJ77DRAFT_172081 [Powellomyces hirtus]
MMLCKGTDHGIWRKIRMGPFESRFVARVDKTAPQGQEGSASLGQVDAIKPIERLIQDAQDTVFEMDKSVKDKINGPWKVAFMHMLIRYYFVWRKEGLEDVPIKMAQNNQDYKESKDMVGKFLMEMCQMGAEYKTHSKQLWARYQ